MERPTQPDFEEVDLDVNSEASHFSMKDENMVKRQNSKNTLFLVIHFLFIE